MEEISKGLRVRNFFEIEAQTLRERYRIIETLLPHPTTRGAAHRGEEGRFIEALLRAFLNKHLPHNLAAVSGFILRPSTKTDVQNLDRVQTDDDKHSSQIDIIIYDMDNYPIFERFEEFCIVPPEGVIGIISVKKTLYNSHIKDEVHALQLAADLCQENGKRGPFTAIFAFSAEEKSDDSLNKRIFNAIREVSKNTSFDSMINEASVMGRTCVFKNRSEHGRVNEARYVAVNCVDEQHIPLQRLLQSSMSVYYDVTRQQGIRRPGFVSFRKRTFKDSPELGFIPYLAV